MERSYRTPELATHAQRVFLHTPPVSRRGRRTPKRVQPPYAGAPRHECSVYFFWWAFLRCDPGYASFCQQGGKGRGAGKYRQLYEDFGDVHATSFLPWWHERGVTLFAEPAERVVRRLEPGEPASSDPEIAVVAIPLSLSLRKINNRVKHLLRADIQQLGKQQRSRALYPVASRPVLSSLHKTLAVHKLREQKPQLHLYELAHELRIRNATLRWDESAHRRWQTNEAARYLRQARHLIDNVAQGIFPMSKPRELGGVTPTKRSKRSE